MAGGRNGRTHGTVRVRARLHVPVVKVGEYLLQAHLCTARERDLYTGQGDRSALRLVFKDFLDWYSNDFYPLVLTDLIHSSSGGRKLAFYEPPPSRGTMEARVKFAGRKVESRRIHYLD